MLFTRTNLGFEMIRSALMKSAGAKCEPQGCGANPGLRLVEEIVVTATVCIRNVLCQSYEWVVIDWDGFTGRTPIGKHDHADYQCKDRSRSNPTTNQSS